MVSLDAEIYWQLWIVAVLSDYKAVYVKADNFLRY